MSKRSPAVPVVAPLVLPEAALRQLLRALVVVEDPRACRGVRHPLINVLTIAVLGCLCRCDDAEALEDWGRKEEDWLAQYLDLPHGVPSQDVFLRVLAAIDPAIFQAAFHAWVSEVWAQLGLPGQIAIDGQTHRGSGNRRSGQKPVHLVHALLCETGVVLGQTATEEKSNEIIAIPALLQLLDLRGALVSIDAMGTQVAIARAILQGDGDYLLALKGNQSSLHTEVAAAFAEAHDPRRRSVDEAAPPTLTTDTQVDGGHGRIETRTAEVITDIGPWVPAAERWPGLQCLVAITATRQDQVTGQTSTEVRYYVASRTLSAAEANLHVRAHWAVESVLHWCMDVSFGQDACRIRTGHASENLSVVRHFALNLLRSFQGDRYSVPRRRRLCDYNRAYRQRLLESVGGATAAS